MKYTQEMLDWYMQRTRKHIFLVSKYIIEMVYHYGLAGTELLTRKDTHDFSKFEEPEKTPYILISWQYHCKDIGIEFPLSNKESVILTNATYHHVITNRHHPEYYSQNKIGIVNRENRDISNETIVDATTMPEIDVYEMIADWLAMSEEKGTNLKDWADKNVGIRWKFNKKQIDNIYQTINIIRKCIDKR